jgi:hypothetical protein
MSMLIALYPVSIIAVAMITGHLAIADEGEIKIKNVKDLWIILGVSSIWPLVLLTIPVIMMCENYERKLGSRARALLHDNKIGKDKNDRSFVVAISEVDLKILLKAHRKELIKLESNQIEIIRDELMHRMTERTLLK